MRGKYSFAVFSFLILFLYSTFSEGKDYKDFVYVANERSNSISVIDPVSNKVIKTILIGDKDIHRPLYAGHIDPHGVIASPEGQMVLITARGSSSLVFIDTENHEVMGYVTTSGREPHACTFTPDGRLVWVTIRGARQIDVFDRGSRKIIAQVPTHEGAGMVAFGADPRYAFVSYHKKDVVSIVDTYNYSIVKNIPVPGKFSPFLMASMKDPQNIWVIHKDVNKVSVINSKTLQISGTVDVGNKPNHVAFIHKGGIEYAYITIAKDNRIDVIEVDDTPRFAKSIPVGIEPHGIWSNPEMTRIYVGHEVSNEVWVIDVTTNMVLEKIPVGEKPIDVVYVRRFN